MVMCGSYLIASYGATFQITTGFGIILQIVSHYLGLVLAPMLFMYISSYVFKFCNYHRMFIHYILIMNLMNVTNWYFRIPISNELYNGIQITITIAFLLLTIGMYLYKRRQLKLCKEKGDLA